jgi:hypothetical protein
MKSKCMVNAETIQCSDGKTPVAEMLLVKLVGSINLLVKKLVRHLASFGYANG